MHKPPLPLAKPKRDFNNPVSPPAHHPAFIPPPPTNNVNLNLPLDIILHGVDDRIKEQGSMVFHTLGDTGGINGTDIEEDLAALMAEQIDESRASKAKGDEPLFFYHLGDVVYYNGMSVDYPVQFYEPYQDSDAPIFAIPGNHDGDTRTRKSDPPDDETTLYGFIQNFCASSPEYIFKHRPTMTQPYVYWTLDAPLATIIGLYSNVDGSLDGRGTFEQQHWLAEQLKDAPKDRALIIAVHHAPYSLDTSHGGYGDIGAALDRAFNATGRTADLVLSGHVHDYQRFMRQWGDKQIPYVVAGAGGYANTQRALHKVARGPNTGDLTLPFQTSVEGVTLAAYNDSEAGFLKLKVTESQVAGEYYTIDFDGNPQGVRDSFSVPVTKG